MSVQWHLQKIGTEWALDLYQRFSHKFERFTKYIQVSLFILFVDTTVVASTTCTQYAHARAIPAACCLHAVRCLIFKVFFYGMRSNTMAFFLCRTLSVIYLTTCCRIDVCSVLVGTENHRDTFQIQSAHARPGQENQAAIEQLNVNFLTLLPCAAPRLTPPQCIYVPCICEASKGVHVVSSLPLREVTRCS